MIGIQTKLVGHRNLIRRFNRLKGSLADRRAIYELALDDIEAFIDKAFDTEGRSKGGSSWKQLAKSTRNDRKWLSRHISGFGEAHPILYRTGHLRNSRERTVGRNRASLIMTAEYASAQNDGKGRIPARRFMPTDNQGKKILKKATDRYIYEELTRAGFSKSQIKRTLAGRG